MSYELGRIMAKTPLDSDIRRLPVTIGILGGAAVSFGAIFSAFVWFQSWVDDRVSVGVRGYSNELIFPRIERVENSQKRILITLEGQQELSDRQHEETTKMLEQILRQR